MIEGCGQGVKVSGQRAPFEDFVQHLQYSLLRCSLDLRVIKVTK